jgi:hypothetical protein
MDQDKPSSVEADTAKGVCSGAILPIANDRVADLIHLDADLILSTRLQPDLDDGTSFVGFDDTIVANGELSTLRFRGETNDLVCAILQVALDRAFSRIRSSLHQCVIDSCLKMLMQVCANGPGELGALAESEKPGNISVQSVARVNPYGSAPFPEIVIQHCDHCFPPPGHSSLCQNVDAFLDDKHLIILVDQTNLRVEQLGSPKPRALDLISRLHLDAKARHQLTVQSQALVMKEASELAPRTTGEHLLERLEQGASGLDTIVRHGRFPGASSTPGLDGHSLLSSFSRKTRLIGDATDRLY